MAALPPPQIMMDMNTNNTLNKVPREAVEKVGETAQRVAGKAVAAAAGSSGVKKVLAYAVGIIAASVAFAAAVFLNSCTMVTDYTRTVDKDGVERVEYHRNSVFSDKLIGK